MKRLFFLLVSLAPLTGLFAQLGVNAEQLQYRVLSTGVQPTVAVTSSIDGRHYEGNVVVPPYVKLGSVIYAVTVIDTAAFANSPYLAAVQLPQTLEKVGSRAFADCPRLVSVQFSSGPSRVESQTFVNCERLQRVVLPYKCEVLESEVFYNCRSLQLITLPATLKRIEEHCFAACSELEQVLSTAALRYVDRSAFEGCYLLKSVPGVASEEPAIAVQSPKPVVAEEKEPESAFLKNDTLPKSLVAEEKETESAPVVATPAVAATWQEREAAFDAHQKEVEKQVKDVKQTTATVGGDVSEYVDPSRYDFSVKYKDNTFYLSIMSNGQAAIVSALPHTSEFQSSQDVGYTGTLSLPDMVTFGGNTYTVTLLADRCFANCRQLQSVVIPATVKDIGDNAFLNCVSLTKVTLPSSLERVSSTAFEGCTTIEYQRYGNGLYLGNPSNPYEVLVKAIGVDITSVDVYITTSLIADGAFYNCRRLTSFKSPLSMRYIGAMAFGNCVNLSKVHITEPNTVIRPSAFSNCEKLTKMNIAGVRTSLGEYEW